MRLTVEIAVLGGGAVGLWIAVQPVLAVIYAGLVIAQYAGSIARVRWLVGKTLS